MRTAEQKDDFRDGLQGFNDLYTHQHVTAIKLTAVPQMQQRKYDDRGWTLAESLLIDTKSGRNNKLTVDGTADVVEEGVGFLMKFSCRSSPPLDPESFGHELQLRKERAEARELHLFTSGKDNDMVPALYAASFQKLLLVRELAFTDSQWGCAEITTFCRTLRLCAPRCLLLGKNRINSSSTQPLCEALQESGTIEFFSLAQNRIGTQGAQHLGAAFAQLPRLKTMWLYGNPCAKKARVAAALREAWRQAGKEPTCLLLKPPF